MLIVIPEERLSKSLFTRAFLDQAGIDVPADVGRSLAGPLRTDDSQFEGLGLTATIQYHDHADEGKHYVIILAAFRRDEASEADPTWPTLESFQQALGTAIGEAEVDAHVSGRHRFSRTKWRGMLELPVPLPSKVEGVKVQLTGVQVTYEGPDGREVVLLDAQGDELTASTHFDVHQPVSDTYLASALQRSVSIATRIVDEISKQKQQV